MGIKLEGVCEQSYREDVEFDRGVDVPLQPRTLRGAHSLARVRRLISGESQKFKGDFLSHCRLTTPVSRCAPVGVAVVV